MIPLDLTTTTLGVASGAIVGLVLGLIGGGGSILAVPLLVYLVGVASTHVAIGTSAVAVAGAALVSLVPHLRVKRVKLNCALVFSAAGVAGALSGAALAKQVDGGWLLAAFGGLMLVVGASMFFGKLGEGDPDIRLTPQTAGHLLPRLVPMGLGVGAISGFFGIGGGFLIVPGLILATGMPLTYAIGTSLVAVSAFGIATAASYAVSGLVDWWLAAIFVGGAALGGLAGAGIGKVLAGHKHSLRIVFTLVVITVGAWIVYRAVAG